MKNMYYYNHRMIHWSLIAAIRINEDERLPSFQLFFLDSLAHNGISPHNGTEIAGKFTRYILLYAYISLYILYE